MVWREITSHGRTPLVLIGGNLTGVQYRDIIIQQQFLLFINAQQRQITLQQDNARSHVSRIVRYLQQNNIDTLPWTAVFSNLTSIMYAWHEMERRLRHLENLPETLCQFGSELVRIWNAIPQALFINIVRSMRCRCRACINAD